jgi:hypothetical protein
VKENRIRGRLEEEELRGGRSDRRNIGGKEELRGGRAKQRKSGDGRSKGKKS